MNRLLMLGVLYLLIFCHSQMGLAETTEEIDTHKNTKPFEAVIDVNWDWYKGNKFSPLVIIEFCDYESPSCSRHVQETLPDIEKGYISTGKVKYMLLDYTSQEHKNAYKAAEAVNCAIDENKVWEMRTRLFSNQNALSPEDLLKHAEAVGLDMPRFKKCMDSRKYAKKIPKDLAEGQKIGITDTPTFLLGFDESEGRVKIVKIMRGFQSFIAFKEAMDSLIASVPDWGPIKGRTFYIRQTVGDDANDGLSPQTAWRHISKLSKEMKAGDTAYVGPGLYREEVTVFNSGTVDKQLTFIADTTGQHTGDPPGIVMLTGAEPIDESIFEPYSKQGVYIAKFPSYRVSGVVDMDGNQYRYKKVIITKEYLVEKMAPIDVVAKFPSSYYYDENTKVLYIHTSDDKHPVTHEIELMKRLNGFFAQEKHYITIMGFTFRHFGDGGINFFKGSSHGIAINNTSYGNRQGIRVYTATDILVYGNTLFMNENCGVYFAARSAGGAAIGNTFYENIKGIRAGSDSVFLLATDNTLFDNIEFGISIEETNGVLVRRNRLSFNRISQLFAVLSQFDSDGNCFDNNPEQSVASVSSNEFKTLADYQNAMKQDQDSRHGGCGPLPQKIDVHKLHEETMTYTDKARKILKVSEQQRF